MIYICGGSNSLLKNGWAHRFIEHSEEPVRNVSIGATCSITGLYRLFFTSDIQPGDTVVWEYALNDANHVSQNGLSEAFLLRYVEVLLTDFAQRGVKLVAVLLKSWSQEKMGRDPSYHHNLKELLDRWRVSYADVSAESRQRLSVAVLPDHCYEESNHYDRSSEIISFIKDRTCELVAASTVPVVTERVYGSPAVGVDCLSSFEEGVPIVTGSRVFSARAWRPRGTLTLVPRFDGRIISLLTWSGRNGGAFDVISSSAKVTFSATLPSADAMKARLSPSFLDPHTSPDFAFSEGELLKIRWSLRRRGLLSGSNNISDLSWRESFGRKASLFGLVVERSGGRGALC